MSPLREIWFDRNIKSLDMKDYFMELLYIAIFLSKLYDEPNDYGGSPWRTKTKEQSKSG